jgi:chromosomal replication initiator protein
MDLPVRATGPKTRKVSWRYTFNDFVVGACNQLAYAACTSLCRTDFQQDNLFLCSGPGLGKTHLAQAIGNELCEQKQQSSINVVYASSEQFANQMVRALKSKDLDAFKKRYRENVDLLLLEDIHFFQGKGKMQEELLSLIKALEESGSKVVFTSSFLPKELKEVDNQLASYFCAGLLAPIEKPDYDVRLRVLQNKARTYQVDIPDDISRQVASSITEDIRQLESCVRNMAMKARLLNQKISEDLARDVLQHYTRNRSSMDLEWITDYVCRTFELTKQKLCSRSRKKQIVLARNAAFYMARHFTELSLKDIGKQFNRRHSTVLKGIANIEREISRDTTVGRQVSRIAEQAKQA